MSTEMLDRDRDGAMGFQELKELVNVLGSWKQLFYRLDKNKTGYIEAAEIQDGR